MADNGHIITEETKPKTPLGEDIVNSITVMEIRVHLLANGKERTEVIAHEFMMTEHKGYMIDKLCEALLRISKGIIKSPNGQFIKNYSEKKRLYLAGKLSEAFRLVNQAVKRTPIIKRLPNGMNDLRQFLAKKRR
jgi:hypothetical protein